MINPKIIGVCGAHTASGGPEAVHQLVDMANQIEDGSAALCYVPCEQHHSVTSAYQNYNIPTVIKKDIPKNSLIILPESLPGMVSYFDQKCALWWLSVDNFGMNETDTLKNFVAHLSQSHYSTQFINSLGFESYNLSDYISDEFYNEDTYEKNFSILVNPAKGMDLIEEFANLNKDKNIVMLKGMSKIDMAKALKQSMVYIDFGHHPGKDRIPREAALSGAVVFSTKNGSANNSIDLPIDDWYKFNSLKELSLKIDDVFNNYKKHIEAQNDYYKTIQKEKSVFKSEVNYLLNNLWSTYCE